jgi:hypothetical protein
MDLVQPSLRLDKKNTTGEAPVVFRLKQLNKTNSVK